MKKIISSVLTMLLIQLSATSQIQTCLPCLPDGITFITQAQVDSFQVMHPGCTEIEGNVTIGGLPTSDITNLNGLSVVTSVGGDLKIVNMYLLSNLNGLESLTSVSGDVIIGSWVMGPLYTYRCRGTSLSSLTGLDNLSFIGGNLEFFCNQSLTNFTGLENLILINGALLIGMCGENGDYIKQEHRSDYGCCGNPSLVNLSGLNNLESIGDIIYIEWNDSLTSLQGLENLTSTDGDIYISSCDVLLCLSALENLTSIGGDITIDNNVILTSLQGLDNIEASSIDELRIMSNNLLSDCAVQSICDYLKIPNGTTNINYNALGCATQQEVEEACEELPVESIRNKYSISISPNPLRTQVKIEIENFTQGKRLEFYLFDYLCREVYKTTITSSPYILKRQGLPDGMYLWKAVGSEGIAAGKLVME